MATNTLDFTHSQGDTIDNSHVNELGQAMSTTFVGRTSAGVPSALQALGSVAFPWATAYITNLILSGSAVDPSLITTPANILTSGKTRATSNQPAFITPAGLAGGAEFDVKGLTTNLVYDVNGVAVTISTDITKGTLTLAPGSNNTCQVNDTDATDGEFTRQWGEEGAQKEYITIDTVGTEISSRVGQFSAFKINDGANDEYFIAYIESATKLSKIYRGFFYASNLLPINRIKFANNDIITLMNLGYVFAQSNGTTIDVSYTAPVYAFSAPGGPATGDYWYKLQEQKWYRYDGATWVSIERTFIGWAVLDDTDCIAARCADFYANYRNENNFNIDLLTTEIAAANSLGQKVNVAGVNLLYLTNTPDWNITTDLATSADMYDVAEQASRLYYLYIKDDGDTVISDVHPYKAHDKFGSYHPHNPWRAVGYIFNDAGSDLIGCSDYNRRNSIIRLSVGNGFAAVDTAIRKYTTVVERNGADVIYFESTEGNTGAKFQINEDGNYMMDVVDGKSGASGATFGASKNDIAGLSVSITASNSEDILMITASGTLNNGREGSSVTHPLKKGDIIRSHGDKTADMAGYNNSRFTIMRVR